MKFSDHGCFIRIATQDFIVRYVKIDSNNEVQIKESFLNFFLLHRKNVDKITKSILNKLQQNGLDVMMCRRQAYDNASTMAEVRAIPFFSASTHRWEVLLKDVPNVVERVIDTRWSVHYEAVKVLQQCFVDVIGPLNELCDRNENIDTRGQARGILDAIQRFSFVSLLQVWLEALRESYDTQKYLQRKGLSLEDCTHKINAFIAFLINERDALVKQCIERAIKICAEQEISIEERLIRRKKRISGEHAEDVGLSAIEEIKRCLLEAMDRFWSEAV